MREFQGYKIIPLKVHRGNKGHSVFARENYTKVKNPEKPCGRTLFLLNLPPYVTEDSLRFAFRHVGDVVSIIFAKKPGKPDEPEESSEQNSMPQSFPYVFKVAYVVFKATTSVQQALELKSINLFDEEGNSMIKAGLEKYTAEFMESLKDEDVMKKEIDDFMSAYDEKQRQGKQIVQEDANEWITVTKETKKSFKRKESVVKKATEKIERNRKKTELKNFFSSQIKESRMQEIANLRRKFEDDKQKIELLKKNRKFRPF